MRHHKSTDTAGKTVLFLPMRGYERFLWCLDSCGFVQLFLPMRGYERPKKRRERPMPKLFLPMRGYETKSARPHDLLSVAVISPHEGL